jgi:hypothetical protein
MEYLKVKWIHSDPRFPVWKYTELDDDRYETRKVELFADGRCGYADDTEEAGGTGLGPYPELPLGEIAKDPEFEAFQISKEEFEKVWLGRHGRVAD